MTRQLFLTACVILGLVGGAWAQSLGPDEVKRLIRENEQLKSENKRLQEIIKGSGQASSATAVVDLQRTYDSLKEKIRVEAEFKTREEAFKTEKDRRETTIKQLADTLKDLPQGSTERAQIEAQFQDAQGDYAVWLRIEAGKINRDRGAWIKQIYTKMLVAVEEAATEKGFDLVLFKVPPIDFAEVQSGQVPRLIQSRKVLWAIDELDLTDLVIQKMNLAYERNRPATP